MTVRLPGVGTLDTAGQLPGHSVGGCMQDRQKASSTRGSDERRPYHSPELKLFGDLAELTRNGGATIGDPEVGSIMDDGR